MTERIDVAVIGAGVVGLAVAERFARAGREVIVIEKNAAIGAETSSRNSEVIHAGFYYRPHGLRARLCVTGKTLLYDFCARYGVNHARCEKLVVARNETDAARLGALKDNAIASGVNDLRLLRGEEARSLEPALRCHAALLSPSTGIVDSHGLMLALRGAIEDAGGVIALGCQVIGGEAAPDGVVLRTGGGPEARFLARTVVNCAGLHAERVARSIEGLEPRFVPQLRFAKGQYFTVTGGAPFSRLIYPMPAPDCLGVHFTRDLGGQAKLGPDIDWTATVGDYSVDETQRRRFFEGAREFWPDLAEDRLQPGYAGFRPKIAGPGEEGDFRIDGPQAHGVRGLINLFGIESPGLTACLAIAEEVRRIAAATP